MTDRKHDEYTGVKMPRAQKRKFEHAAALAGLSLSAFVREATDAAANQLLRAELLGRDSDR